MTTTSTDDSNNDCQCGADDVCCVPPQSEINVEKEMMIHASTTTSQTSSQNYFTKENEIEKLKSELLHYKQQHSDFNTIIHALKPHPPQPTFLSPAMVLNKMKNDGIRKSKLTIDQLIILSVMSGLFIGFAGTFALFTAGNCKTMEIDNPGLNKFFFGA